MTHAVQYALTHGALVLFVWILFQQLGVPIPSAPLLISVGSLASSGRIDFASSLMAAFGASFLADTFWYHMGWLAWSRSDYLPLTTANWKGRALALIKRHSGRALVVSKFVAGSNFVSLLAGRRRLSVPQFLLYDGIASFAWSGGYMAIGYLLRNQVQWTVDHGWITLFSLLVATAVWPAVPLLLHRSKPLSRVATKPIHSAVASRCWRKILTSAAGLSSQIRQFASTSVSNAFGKLRLLALTITVVSLPLATGCWVQSVYPFYEESDVVADDSLVGAWAGEAELQPCLLNVAFDPGEKVYNIAMSKSAEAKQEMKCTEISAKGHLVQLGSQRFLDVIPTDEKSLPELHSLVKVKPDRQNLVLVPMDADWLADAIRGKTFDLTARIDEKVVPPVDVILTSPTPDLRNLLRKSGDAEGVFSDIDQMRFHKK